MILQCQSYQAHKTCNHRFQLHKLITHSTSQFDNSNPNTSLNLSHNANQSPIPNLNFNPYSNVNHSPNFNLNPDVNLNTNINPNISQGVNLYAAHQTQSKSMFKLKWVAGTRVLCCYSCKGDIINPPQLSPDDLCVLYCDIREFHDRNKGQLQYTNLPKNVHFHLKASRPHLFRKIYSTL